MDFSYSEDSEHYKVIGFIKDPVETFNSVGDRNQLIRHHHNFYSMLI